jgi:hypothetical protein
MHPNTKTKSTASSSSMSQQNQLGTLWHGRDAVHAKSLAAGDGASLRICFRNRSHQTLLLCWVSAEGDLHHFYALPPFKHNNRTQKRRFFRRKKKNDLVVTKDDHVETTQTGHAFLILASTDVHATAQSKSLEGTTILGAYRPLACADEDSENGDDEPTQLHLVTIQNTRSSSSSSSPLTCPSCRPCPHPFLRTKPMALVDNQQQNYTEDQDWDINHWLLSVQRATIDPTPIDTTRIVRYTQARIPVADWPVRVPVATQLWCSSSSPPSSSAASVLSSFQATFQSDLVVALRCLPVHARTRLCQTTPFWINVSPLQYGPQLCPVTGDGMCFHPAKDWLLRNGMLPDKCHGIELYSMECYGKDRVYWQPGGLLIHELSHAYHCLCLPGGYENREILECYQAAMKDGLYDMVEVHDSCHRNGNTAKTKVGKTMAKAYACQDAMEYFAELSTAFLGGTDDQVEFNKWYPFNRKQLQEHDPRAHELLKRLWKVELP